MHLKFLARGTGSAAAAAAYLLAKRDAAGTERAAVEVLRGDPLEVARVADGLPFKYLYTSGVLAWSPEDAPTRAEIERVLDEFEETAWAGLDRDRYIWSAVLHRDHDGGVHVHIFTARCDLATGRSLNIAAPGWQKTFDPLRDAFNYEHGWSRPDDPARARPYRPSPHLAYLDAETLRAGWEVEPDRRALIGEHLMGRVTDGAVKDRAGVVAALEGLGFEVPRHGRHYVTILRPETGERLRLKGGLYEADFDRERFLRQVWEPSGDRDRADRGDDAKRAADAWRDLEEKRRKRAEYHRSRYGGGGRARAGGARDAAGDVERESGAAAGAVEREAVPESLAGHLRRELGDEAVVAAGDSVAERRQELEAIRGAAAGDATACLAVVARVSVADDRDRAGADSGLARVVGAVRAGAAAAGRADRGLAGAGRVLAGAGRTARGCGDGLDRAVRDAGPDLTELMRQRQEQRALVVAGREQAVCATSKGSEWLNDAQQEVLAGAVRRPTVAERVLIVGAVEDRIETYLAAREDSLAATSTGSMLLRAEYGEGGSASSPQQSFAKRETAIARVAQQVDEKLEAREETLRSMPLGRQYLSAAEQARAGGASGPPTPAERESMVRAAEQRVREELDRREERVLADTGDGRLLADAAEELTESGAIFGDGGLTERTQIIGRAEGLLEEERAELKLKAADLLEDAAGEELLRKARLDVLGAADREAQTLADSWAVINQAAERKWEGQWKARVEALDNQLGGMDLYHAHLADIDPKWGVDRNATTTRGNKDAALSAAESDGARLERLRVVLSDEAAATRYRKELGKVAVQFKTADLDRALSSAEQERAERETRRWEEKRDASVEAVGRLPGGMDLYYAHLADRDPAWSLKKNDTTSRGNINTALDAARSDNRRLERLRVVLSDAAAATRYREVLDDSAAQFTTADLDRALAAGEREREEREAAARRAAALETATATAQAAAARSNVKLPDAHVRVIYETGETHAAGLAAVERTTQALDDAANQRLPADTVIHTWKANRSDPGGIAAALDAATADARRDEERAAAAAARVSRLEQLFDEPASAEAFIVALDDEAPSWRTGTRPACIDRALDVAERGLGRRKAATWRHQQHELVLKAEQQFPGAPSAAWRDAGRSFSGQTAIDRHGESVSLMLSDRACARALATEGPSAEPEPARNLMQRVWLRTEVERQQLQALRARTKAARLAQRNHNAVRPVVEKSPPAPKRARLVPDATWEDAEPLWRAVTDLQERTERGRLAQRARNAATAVPEKTPPAPRRARLVPDATREDAVAAAPLIVRARLPEAEQQELRFGVDIVAKELAGEFGRYQWWSHAGGELKELHLREDRYLNDTKKGPVEIGMLRTVLEKNVYEKAFRLVEHPAAEPDPPPNLVGLVRAFIRRLQDAVDRLIDRVLDREPAHPSRPAAAADQVPARPAPQPPVAPTEPALGQPVPPAAAASPIVEPPAAPAGVSGIDVKPQLATTTNDEATAEPGRREASPPPATAPAPEPALNVTEAERVRVAVDAVKAKLPRTQPHSGNRSHRPPAVSDERFDHLAAATDDEFVKKVVTELQRRQAYYTDSERSESEETHLRPTITRKYDENLVAYEKADAARGFFSRRPPKPTRAAAESVAIEEFEAEQLVLIEGVCRNIQQWSPAAVRRELQPKQESTLHLSRSSSHTNEQDREDTSQSR